MSTDLDPRKHLFQYGALGVVCAVFLGLLVTWTTVLGNRLLKHLDRVDDGIATQSQAQRSQARAMDELAKGVKETAEGTREINAVLRSIRITGRRTKENDGR